jgi:hypothetical protein
MLAKLRRLWLTHRNPRWLTPDRSGTGPVSKNALWRADQAQSFIIKWAERTQIQLQAVTHMFFSQAVPVQRSRSARLRLENARRS